MNSRIFRGLAKSGLLLCTLFLLLPANAATDTQPKPQSVTADSFGITPNITDIPDSVLTGGPTTQTDAEIETGIKNPILPKANGAYSPDSMDYTGPAAGAPIPDGAVQSNLVTPSIPAPGGTFAGLAFTDNQAAGIGLLSPPDPNGAVGPNHYVQQVNLLVRVYDKNGNPLTSPFKLSSLWVAAGLGTSQCALSDPGDPIVIYDALADRWLLSQFGFTATNAPPYHECVAISKTNDPTGAYYVYDFVLPGNEFPDYPHIGAWSDAYYMTTNQFLQGGNFDGAGTFAFNRSKMLLGDPTANLIYFNQNLASHPEGLGGMLPATLDGLTPPPAGKPGIFAYFTSTVFGDPANGLRLFDFHADFVNPAYSSFKERAESTYAAPVAVAAFDPTVPPTRRAVPQPSPANTVTTALDAITDRLMYRMQYRNVGTYETLVVNHTVGSPASTIFGTFRAAPRYYELRSSSAGGPFAVNEQATYAPADGTSRWMGSAGEDGNGNLALGFDASSSTVFPSVMYAGRLASDPPGGLFQGENTIIAGTGVQRSTTNRWGDYSALTIDPSDDCTFWYTNEYYTAASQAAATVGWLTRIGNFKFTGCTPPPRGTLRGNITNCQTNTSISGAMVQVNDGHSGTSGSGGNYSISLPPGTYTAYANGYGYSRTAANSFTITNGGTATLNACLTGNPILTVTSSSVSGGGSTGTTLKPADCEQINATLSNSGPVGLTNATATLTSSTPGISISQPTSTYPNLASGGSGANATPFSITTSPTLQCGAIANFTLKVSSAQGNFSTNFSRATCANSSNSFSGSIASNSGDTQTGRLTRNGVGSSCSFVKAAPGINDTATRHRTTLGPFTNNNAGPACVTASVTSGCGTNLYYSVYSPTFNPASILQNFLADPGLSSAGTSSWSFLLSPGQQFFLDVNEVTANSGCASFSGNFTGLDGSGGVGACSVGVVAGTVNLSVSAQLSLGAGGTYQGVVTVTNNGTGTAQNVQLNTATLGSPSGTPLPQSMGSLAPNGGSATVLVTFPASAGAPGAAVVERYTGSYSGGTFSTSIRAVLPSSANQ